MRYLLTSQQKTHQLKIKQNTKLVYTMHLLLPMFFSDIIWPQSRIQFQILRQPLLLLVKQRL